MGPSRTPKKAKVEASTTQKRRRDEVVAPVTASPVKASRPTRVAQASRALDFGDEENATGEVFVPVATHNLIGYQPKGGVLAPEKRAVFDYVLRVCDVPVDFEADHTYGAKSGTTYEDRLITAYLHELLPNPDDKFRRKLKKLVVARAWPEASAACTARLAAK